MLLLSTPRQSWAGETPEKLFRQLRLSYDIPAGVPDEVTEETLIPAVTATLGFTEEQCHLSEISVLPPHEEILLTFDTRPYTSRLELAPLYWDGEGVFQVVGIESDNRGRVIPLFTRARLPEFFDEENLTPYPGDSIVGFAEALSYFAEQGREASDAHLLRLREDIGDMPMMIETTTGLVDGLTLVRSKTFIALTPEGYPFFYTNIYSGADLYSTDYPESLSGAYTGRRGAYPNATN